MKLFFCAMAAAATVTMLTGCGTSKEDIGKSYSTQMADVTLPGAGVPEVNISGSANISESTNISGSENTSGLTSLSGLSNPDVAAPEVLQPGSMVPDAEEDNLRSPSLENTSGIEPVRVVAKNVKLGKENIGGLTENELYEKLAKVAKKTDISVIDASFNQKTWAIRKEKVGKRLAVDKIVEASLNADAGEKIQLSYSTVQPKVKSTQLNGKVRLIAKFTTPFLDRSRSRIKNIRLTSSKLDRRIIQPGQEFSFNRVTGSKSKKFGYENATIIVKTPKGPKHKKAPGGGVCQVSTTLYNAVLKCGLKVTERHEHSDDVFYVPDGKDATVTYRGPDLRFINTRDNPIMLRVYVGRRSLQVTIYENTGLQL